MHTRHLLAAGPQLSLRVLLEKASPWGVYYMDEWNSSKCCWRCGTVMKPAYTFQRGKNGALGAHAKPW